ncbi:MAG: TIGR00296 family protein [Candidatus Bathyarchaeia archaeon]
MEAYTLEDGRILVQTAREAVSTWLRRKVAITPPPRLPDKLHRKSGVFVTLNRFDNGSLRGCIGYPTPVKPLIQATIEVAIEAATSDPRFPPVSLKEFEENIVVEVSILTQPKKIEVPNPKDLPKQIRIGVDGLIVEKGWAKGLLLPQVATEWGMDAEEFLCHCCLKAGLPPDEWTSRDVKVSKFQAHIFKEKSPGGEVVRGESVVE